MSRPTSPARSRATALRSLLTDSRPAWIALALWACFDVFYFATGLASLLQTNDTASADDAAWQLASHGNLYLDRFAATAPWLVHAHGHLVSNRFPGVIFFGAPFYLLARGGKAAALGPGIFAGATAASAAVALLYLLIRRMGHPTIALPAALVAALGTSTWSVSGTALWTHGPDQLWLTGAMVSLQSGWWLAAGGLLGLAVLTRPHLSLAAASIGGWIAAARRSFPPLVQIGAGSAAGALLLLLYNRWVYGRLSLLGGYAASNVDVARHSAWWFVQNYLGALLSPSRGTLALSPFLLALLPGLGAAWRVAPAWVRGCSVAGLIYGVTQLAFIRFEGANGGFYSYRVTIESLTLAAPLLVLAWVQWTARTPARRHVFSALVGISIFEQMIGVLDWRASDNVPGWTTFPTFDAIRSAGPVVTLVVAAVSLVLALLISGHLTRRSYGAVRSEAT